MITLETTRRHTLNLALKRTIRTPDHLGTPTTTNNCKLQNIMHPDCLLLPKHGVTSPRLSLPSMSGGSITGESTADILMNVAKEGATCDSVHIDDDSVTTEMEEDGDEDDVIVHEESTPIVSDSCNAELDNGNDDVDDMASCCSESSVLSVGQERDQALAADNSHREELFNVSRQQLLMSTLYHPSAFSSVANPKAEQPIPSMPETHITHGAHILDPLAVVHALRAAPAAAAAVTAISPFQEEFLRKSQLYAEELMKQQMQLMAAARVNVLTLRNAAAGRLPSGALPLHMRPTGVLPTTAGIQNQLNAISKMTQYLTSSPHNATAGIAPGSDALAKLTATAMGITQMPTATKLPASFDKLHSQLPFQLQHDNENDSALKFSIDNILKADFGVRPASGDSTSTSTRNSSPIGAIASPASAARSAGRKTKPVTISTSNAITTTATTATSASKSTAATPMGSSYSSTLANICTNSNDSAASSTCGGINRLATDLSKSPSALESSIEANTTTNRTATAEFNSSGSCSGSGSSTSGTPMVWPAWVYCTRYSDRPSSGPRTRKPKKPAPTSNGGGGGGGGVSGEKSDGDTGSTANSSEDKRPRTAFSGSQLARLKHEFNENRYLTEKRRQQLSSELGLNEAQIKIWFQNKRAKLKKSSGTKNPLALQLMAQGLYNHSTIPLTREEEELQELQEREMQSATTPNSTGT